MPTTGGQWTGRTGGTEPQRLETTQQLDSQPSTALCRPTGMWTGSQHTPGRSQLPSRHACGTTWCSQFLDTLPGPNPHTWHPRFRSDLQFSSFHGDWFCWTPFAQPVLACLWTGTGLGGQMETCACLPPLYVPALPTQCHLLPQVVISQILLPRQDWLDGGHGLVTPCTPSQAVDYY